MKMSKSRALIDHMPMAIDKGLATVFGLDLAALLQEIHFSVTAKELNPQRYQDSLKDGYFWYYDTKANIQTNMPFLGSARTIQRLIAKGQEHGVLVVGEYNKMPGDNTNWFRINHIVLHQKMEEHYSKQNPNRYVNPDLKHTPPRQNVSTPETKCPDPQDKMAEAPGQIGSTNTIDFSETSSETSHRKEKEPANAPSVFVDGKSYSIPKNRKIRVGNSGRYRTWFLPQHNPQGFVEFLTAYPLQISDMKSFAEKHWDKHKISDDDIRESIADFPNRLAAEWKGGKFHHPRTYLENAMWENPAPVAFLHESPFEQNSSGTTINVAAETVETGQTTTAMSLFAPPPDRPKRSMRDIFGNVPGIDFDAFEEAGQ